MSCLASTFNLVVDRGVCCVGHGKSIVDAINGTDNNAILQVTHRQVKHADETDLNKSLNVYQSNFAKMEKGIHSRKL